MKCFPEDPENLICPLSFSFCSIDHEILFSPFHTCPVDHSCWHLPSCFLSLTFEPSLPQLFYPCNTSPALLLFSQLRKHLLLPAILCLQAESLCFIFTPYLWITASRLTHRSYCGHGSIYVLLHIFSHSFIADDCVVYRKPLFRAWPWKTHHLSLFWCSWSYLKFLFKICDSQDSKYLIHLTTRRKQQHKHYVLIAISRGSTATHH